MSWAIFTAFFTGGIIGASLLAWLHRDDASRRAKAHWRDRVLAIRYYTLLRYTAERGLRCPEGADFGGWLSLVEAAMVKDEADRRLAGEQQD